MVENCVLARDPELLAVENPKHEIRNPKYSRNR